MGRFISNSEVQGQWSGSEPRAKAVQKICPMCGAGLLVRRKTYCGPCSDKRQVETIRAWKRKHYKPKSA